MTAAVGAASGAALAATPKAPTLKIKVPASVRAGEKFRIYLYVTYDKKTTRTKPYLVAYVQFSHGACKPTAQAEHALPGPPRGDWALDFQGTVTNSPFTRWDNWTSGTLRGTRHVCAYLYAKSVTPKSNARPILTASATYKGV